MKKSIILSMLMLIGITGVQAQESEYVPLVREGVKWVYYLGMRKSGDMTTQWRPLTIEFKGDTTFNGYFVPSSLDKTFKKCYMTIDPEYKEVLPVTSDENGTFLAAMMRENDKRVFAIYTENYMNAFIPRPVMHSYVTGLATGTHYGPIDPDDTNAIDGAKLNEMWMIYDFNDPASFIKNVSFSFNNDIYYYNDKCAVELESVLVNGTLRKRYGFESEKDGDSGSSYFPEWVEGVGWSFLAANQRFSTFVSPFGDLYRSGVTYTKFSHVEEDGKAIFKGPFFDEFNTPDGLDEVIAETPGNGDNRYYNLMGQPVAEPTQPGIYIKGCRKVIVK